jgi:hypothetical protein
MSSWPPLTDEELLSHLADDETYSSGGWVPAYGIVQARSPQWNKLRLEVLRAHPYCAFTGVGLREYKGAMFAVHHIQPFHLYPELELDIKNLIVLMSYPYNVHFLMGHLLNWNRWNPDIVAWCRRAIKDFKE